MNTFKPLILAGLTAVVLLSQSAQAQGPAPYNYGYAPYGAPAPYGNPYQNNNGFNQFSNNGPFNNGPFRNGPFGGNNGPYGGNNRFFGGNNGPFGGNNSPFPFGRNNGPFGGNNGPFGGNNGFGEQFWPGRGSVYDDILPANGPWNRSWGRAPWNRNYDNLWGRNGGPSEWFNPGDPKEGVAQAWEDMLVTPHGLGTMPGGWKAPSISVPNPIDVGDEFKDVARDMPSEIQNFSEGFNYGDEGYNNGNQGNRDSGGISFDPSRRR